MFRVRVERTLNVRIEEVFRQLSDHGNYDRFPGVDASEVLERGADHPNGVGALRRVKLGSIVLWERITRFESPTRLDYRIERGRPLPMNHEIGSIRLKPAGERTEVVWVSEGSVSIPVVGLVIDAVLQRRAARGFEVVLRFIEAQASSDRRTSVGA